MQRGTIFAALGLAVALTGCQGPENLTAPRPSDNYVSPPTIVQESHLSPSTNTEDTDYGGAHTDVPEMEDDDTCEAV